MIAATLLIYWLIGVVFTWQGALKGEPEITVTDIVKLAIIALFWPVIMLVIAIDFLEQAGDVVVWRRKDKVTPDESGLDLK